MAKSRAQITADYRKRHPERVRNSWRKWSLSLDGTATLLLNYARDRSRRNGLPFNLDRDFILEKLESGVCEISGIELERTYSGKYYTHPFSPSLDRRKPSAGYVKSNVRLVCVAVNRAKCDWEDEILFKLAKRIVENQCL